MINIAIADDHLLFAHALRMLLQPNTELKIIGVVSDGSELLDLVSRESVDLVIVDYLMPGMNGLMLSKLIRSSQPDIKIMLISGLEEAAIIDELKHIGVNGYISKTSSGPELVDAIFTICEGNTVFPEFAPSAIILPAIKPGIEDLTLREKEIIALIVAGYSSLSIAVKLFISVNTVKGHRKNIFKKLSLNNLQELIAYAITHHLN